MGGAAERRVAERLWPTHRGRPYRAEMGILAKWRCFAWRGAHGRVDSVVDMLVAHGRMPRLRRASPRERSGAAAAKRSRRDEALCRAWYGAAVCERSAARDGHGVD